MVQKVFKCSLVVGPHRREAQNGWTQMRPESEREKEIAADFFRGCERTNARQTGREEKGIKRNGGEIVVK